MVEVRKCLEKAASEVFKVAARDAIETCSVIGALIKMQPDQVSFEY